MKYTKPNIGMQNFFANHSLDNKLKEYKYTMDSASRYEVTSGDAWERLYYSPTSMIHNEVDLVPTDIDGWNKSLKKSKHYAGAHVETLKKADDALDYAGDLAAKLWLNLTDKEEQEFFHKHAEIVDPEMAD
ncbi:MAG: hypothetical protein FWE16_04640 [Firmicutes bacterium]|nr:hypothetical protein [Bacillota bacterium]